MRFAVSAFGLALLMAYAPARAESFDAHRDRGSGIATSMFGTYVRPRELLVYPFFEYYRDHDFEYKPSELGYPGDVDLRGHYRASEGLLFLGYGVSDRLALEIEVAVISAELEPAPGDPSGIPPRLRESGLGDVEALGTWRWFGERGARPELFTFLEVVFPFQDRPLIGTEEFEFKLGTGAIRGFRFGTLSVRAAVEHGGEGAELGEIALEYLKRVTRGLALYGGVEAAQDEVELITEAQVRLGPRAVLKLNNGFGLTSKATDWAPEIGLMLSFGGAP